MAASDAFYKGAQVGNIRQGQQKEGKKEQAARDEVAQQELMARREEIEQGRYHDTSSAPNDALTEEPYRKSEAGKYGETMSEFEKITGRKSAF